MFQITEVFICPYFAFRIFVLIAECLPDGTVQVTNPNVGVYSHVFAVQDEGVSAAVKCTVSSSGAQSNITGCSQVSVPTTDTNKVTCSLVLDS